MEVEACEERFADLLAAQNIVTPSEEDFVSADLNGDGTLEFEEWQELWKTFHILRFGVTPLRQREHQVCLLPPNQHQGE